MHDVVFVKQESLPTIVAHSPIITLLVLVDARIRTPFRLVATEGIHKKETLPVGKLTRASTKPT